jgi:predicted nucleic acid-binding Zn ribbon protein
MRPKDDSTEATGAEGGAAADQPVETRTTALQEQSCRVCGSPIRGRKTNGFCSDKCRMADRRAVERADRHALVEHLRFVVALVEAELLGTRSSSEAQDGHGE